MPKKGLHTVLISFAVLAAGCLVFLNCGVKKRPIPPSYRTPKPITDLSHRIDNGVVVLTWNIPKAKKEGLASIKAFWVYRGKKSLKSTICPRCPVAFKKIADIAVGDLTAEERAQNRVSFADVLEKDHRYSYKVLVCFQNARRSDDSNIVEFSY